MAASRGNPVAKVAVDSIRQHVARIGLRQPFCVRAYRYVRC
jgi:hypothetical protein